MHSLRPAKTPDIERPQSELAPRRSCVIPKPRAFTSEARDLPTHSLSAQEETRHRTSAIRTRPPPFLRHPEASYPTSVIPSEAAFQARDLPMHSLSAREDPDIERP
jgi:hypothetical protein